MKHLKSKKGFTLTELIVVMAVGAIFFTLVGIISASYIKMFNRQQDKSETATDMVIVENMVKRMVKECNSNGYVLNIVSDDTIQVFDVLSSEEKGLLEVQFADKMTVSSSYSSPLESQGITSITFEEYEDIGLKVLISTKYEETYEYFYLVFKGVNA